MHLEGMLSGTPAGPLLFVMAAAVAFAAAVPAGPISIMAVERALGRGFKSSFGPSMGAVAGDALFGVAAALGAGYISSVFMTSRLWLKVAGGVLLILMGAVMLLKRAESRTTAGADFGAAQLTGLNFFLVLANPLTLAFYLAAFSFLGMESGRLLSWRTWTAAAGIAAGAIGWFALICAAAGTFHRKLEETILKRIRLGVGVLFIILGLISAISTFTAG